MKRFMLRATLLALFLISAVVPAFAQDAPFGLGEGDDPNAYISWPPPVHTLRGEFDIWGSANLPNMTNYFISYRSLDDNFEPFDNEFAPAILPATAAIQDDILGTWDTTMVDDGLYEIRLTVNVRGGQPVINTVFPVRVLNDPPPFVAEEEEPIFIPTSAPTNEPIFIPTTAPIIEPTVDASPRVIANRPSVNVRSGDSTEYAQVGFLTQGQEAPIVGISSRGTGWYQIRLPNNTTAWVSPTVVDVAGSLSNIPSILPPPIPATATPLPTATPSTQVNLFAGNVVIEPGTPTCAQTFTVGLDVANVGTQQSASGTVSLVDSRTADGSVQGSTVGGFPALLPGQTFRVLMPITISTWYNETHRLTMIIDPSNAIPETNEGDNQTAVEYVLQKGACP